ncbi:ATP-binding cassette domain-containing protein [Geobacillus thermodenitrificans]|nr:ATP-binding cassette domain-containing protein [Geobacillus thermodenitrificans]
MSKGQIQQIAFARIFMKDVDVLIFDEATSNMDPNAKEALVPSRILCNVR